MTDDDIRAFGPAPAAAPPFEPPIAPRRRAPARGGWTVRLGVAIVAAAALLALAVLAAQLADPGGVSILVDGERVELSSLAGLHGVALVAAALGAFFVVLAVVAALVLAVPLLVLAVLLCVALAVVAALLAALLGLAIAASPLLLPALLLWWLLRPRRAALQ